MKNLLLQENEDIISEFFELKSLLPLSSQPQLSATLANFRKLSSNWLSLIQTCESEQKTLKDRHSHTQSTIAEYKKLQLKTQLRLNRYASKEQKVKKVQEKVATHLTIFPKLWNKNLQRLKRKSISWRFTPFTSPTYDQEFEFLQESKIEPDYSVEFEKVMHEISLNKKNVSQISEKSGWNSYLESENDSQDMSEIKNAISVLQKANLLKPENQSVLTKITQLIKNPEKSDKLVLYLQLLSINNSAIPSFTEKNTEKDVKIEELLEATSFLSSVGPKRLENSILEISSENYSIDFKHNPKFPSLGKCSTKEMT